MRLERFGDTWATSYVLGQVQAEEEHSIERPAVIQTVSGQSGGYDVWADENGPWGPVVISKSFTLTANSYTAIEAAYNALVAATVARGRSHLGALLRDGTTHVWAWAKCISVSRSEKPGQFLHLPVTVKFVLPEGVWYSALPGTANRTGAGNLTCVNSGNVRALVRAVVAAGAVNPGLAIGAGPPIWVWTGTVGAAGLVVDPDKYLCTNNAVDAYASLSYGVAGIGQIEWFWLPLGSNTVIVTMTGSYLVTLTWYDTFLM